MHTLDWLKRLISFDTTSRCSNLELIQTIQAWFSQHNLPTFLTYNKEKNKANLLGIVGDSTSPSGILLSGHTDTVPVDGQAWLTNPFKVEQVGECLYGRGTADMKGFLAVLLTLVPELKKLALRKPIYFAFSYDEEVGCHGAPLLIKDMLERGMKPSACIVGEPTQMKLIVGHKGINVLRIKVQGLAAHSSLTPQGCNAVEYAADLICFLRKLANQFKAEGPFDYQYDVPFTTLSVNHIAGGNAYNIIPASCELIVEFRRLSMVDPNDIEKRIQRYINNDLLPRMHDEHDGVDVVLETIGAAPSFEMQNHPAINLFRTVSKNSDIGKVAYATEAGLFQKAGIPTVVCGPGSIEQAHKPNEFIALDQLRECEYFLREAIVQWDAVSV